MPNPKNRFTKSVEAIGDTGDVLEIVGECISGCFELIGSLFDILSVF